MANWWELADCQYTDPEVFYTFGDGATASAKRVCAGCPVRMDCLKAAMVEETPGAEDSPKVNYENRFGVRGGLTAGQRWKLVYPKERVPA